MTDKGMQQQTYFHNYQKHQRLNNPTYNSHFVNDSLTLFTPQKAEPQHGKKQSEYKSNFDPLTDKINTLGIYQAQHNYGRFSKQAFEKSKSYLSQYASNLLSNNKPQSIYKK